MTKLPLIHLFSSPKGYYFFETNKNTIVQVPKDTFYLLHQLFSDTNVDTEKILASPQLKDLTEKGYLSTKRPFEIEHLDTNNLEYLLSRKIEQLTLQVTQDCNFRCKYCSFSGTGKLQRMHTNKTMPLEVAKRAVDFLHQRSVDANNSYISFYGGEPFLALSLIKEVVQYANEVFEGRELSYSITTNGSIINDEVIEMCEENNISLLISIDGSKESHDKNRVFAANGKGTFDAIMNNMRWIKNRYPDFLKKVRLNMVVDPSTNYRCVDNFFLEYDLFEKASANASLVDSIMIDGTYDASDDFVNDAEYQSFLGNLSILKRVRSESLSVLANSNIGRIKNDLDHMVKINSLPDIMAPAGPCVPGVMRPMVNIYGTLYPCERCNESSEMMKIGDIERGYDLKRVERLLNIGKIRDDLCKDCWMINKCSTCAVMIDTGSVLSGKKKIERCETIKADGDYLLRKAAMFYELSHSIYGQKESMQ
ncbi:Cys-rich peptide radical SAM maturase CcpM [Eubacteriales bacterium OttesenSCG-928-N14]|nr:Cys-rich peptide radical SAM maturase CcpM [Eubacteriales bacterium OttesenSCG-928-N14]